VHAEAAAGADHRDASAGADATPLDDHVVRRRYRAGDDPRAAGVDTVEDADEVVRRQRDIVGERADGTTFEVEVAAELRGGPWPA
jgi:hypothetical protein